MPRWAPSAARGGDALGRVAAFGGILFGYDSGYINGVLAMNYFKQEFGGKLSRVRTAITIGQLANHHTGPSNDPSAFNGHLYTTAEQSLIVSILSAGTFFGALFAGSLADWIGRRSTIITGCGIFSLGVVLQVASTTVSLLVVGRLIAGIGIGFVSAVIILYMSEVAPKAIRGAIVSGELQSQ
jgi:MFS family permease